ncbi:MAG: DNA-directed RNA polymerase subunit beta [Deltaproteobacteria bacterium]|nr:DNA-directed RNA polymerase subunit beta [Deltaproteobacteria bacterium]
MSRNPLFKKRIRKNFGRIRSVADIPDLIGMQRRSYDRFLQRDVLPDERENIGLQSVFLSVFPIKDFVGNASLEFVSYKIREVQHTVEECLQRGLNYEIPIRITVRLVVYDVDKELGSSNIRDIKEQEIYFGTIPEMTPNGTFIINGTERVVVSQLHRSPGVFFDHDKGKTHSSGKIIYTSRMIPVRGSWIDMEVDTKGIVYIKIDRRRKFPATILFKALGYTVEDILKYFYQTEKITLFENNYFRQTNKTVLVGRRSLGDIANPVNGEIIVKKGRIFTRKVIKRLQEAKITEIPISEEELFEKFFAYTIYNPNTSEAIAQANAQVTQEILDAFKNAGINQFEVILIDGNISGDSIRKTLELDKADSRPDALLDIYRRLRPGNPVTPEVALDFVDNLFFKFVYYDLSRVGRMKINQRFDLNTPVSITTLRKEDILITAKALVKLRDTQGAVDDIDHLGNRRVRAVGELLANQYRIGLVRMERAIKERMSIQEVDAMMPQDLVNSKPVTAVVKEFFATSQLSQFMDQTNPLSETTHKRRLSALGPGGLTRERAGFEVRDVHPSHYGRICPIETPEGPNIGLIVSLSTYARVNDFGFIETPYCIVEDMKALKEVKYLTAFEEKNYTIAQANAKLDEIGRYVEKTVTSRVEGDLKIVKREEIKLMDVSPNQLVSVAAALIPFLENDDANRALMGSNMQRQAVPLLKCQAPLVGTGMESIVCKNAGTSIVAKKDGIIDYVDASTIVVKHNYDINAEDKDVTVYNLSKFYRTNQNTCFNQRPILQKGDIVKVGDIVADGLATDNGELALGQNITVAFMSWGGYNFEDSILVSENLVKEGTFTSVHIEEFEIIARDTKIGKEEITRDIPNVGEEALKDLDDSGMVRIGAEVVSGDILVGKITPKGETRLSPEEKLLRAIFGEKAGDVKDTSLRVPPGVEGIVIDVKVFSRKGIEKDQRNKEIEGYEKSMLEKNKNKELKVIEQVAKERIAEIVTDKTAASTVKVGKDTIIAKGNKITAEILSQIPLKKISEFIIEKGKEFKQLRDILEKYKKQVEAVKAEFEIKIKKYEEGHDLLPGIIKMIKVHVAMKRKLSVGDKMAGRHGNKGVVSRILPQEDMPHFEDGRPVDMILNPLGVPSRMNVGQILEIHLGQAARSIGELVAKLAGEKRVSELREKMKKIFSNQDKAEAIDSLNDDQIQKYASLYKNGVPMATPVFDGATEEEIKSLLHEAGFSETGQAILYDGRTGESFDKEVTVGVMYMLKLHHLVDDKIHARSIGPYSLVTQQPLGGKAQFGGQRLGEMEVWAMEAYGAAYALQEFLTVKSDDMVGRTRMYEKIIKGQNLLEPGIPESFNVLTKELRGLGLDIELLKA